VQTQDWELMDNSVWRLIPLVSASGSVQMAIDQWLLEQHLAGQIPPTLRFYTWQPAAISLGYHQRRWPEFWQELSWRGIPVELVRRPSGGRAVLHQGELIPVQLPLSEGGDDLIATVIDVLSAAACRCLEIELEVQPLSEEEWQAIANVEGRRKKEEGKYIRYPTS
jgi:lipoate-protein ligase A